MNAQFHPSFEKQFDRLSPKLQEAAEVRLSLFRREPFHPILRNHPLTGTYRGHRSINITGDWRAVYRPVGKEGALFIAVGTHSQLYGK